MEKIEKEEEEKQEEEEVGLMVPWSCPACTFQNPPANAFC